jgi:hypothetical protein
MKQIYNFITKYKKEIIVILILIIIYIGIYYFYSKNKYEGFQIEIVNNDLINVKELEYKQITNDDEKNSILNTIPNKGLDSILGLEYMAYDNSFVSDKNIFCNLKIITRPWGGIYYTVNIELYKYNATNNSFELRHTINNITLYLKYKFLKNNFLYLQVKKVIRDNAGNFMENASNNTYLNIYKINTDISSIQLIQEIDIDNNYDLFNISDNNDYIYLNNDTNIIVYKLNNTTNNYTIYDDNNNISLRNKYKNILSNINNIIDKSLSNTKFINDYIYITYINNYIKIIYLNENKEDNTYKILFNQELNIVYNSSKCAFNIVNNFKYIIINFGNTFVPFLYKLTNIIGYDCVGSFVNEGECSATCGGGTQNQIYDITIPEQFGGETCPNETGDKRVIDCNIQDCPTPINCVGEYQNSGECVANDPNLNCGPGTQQQEYRILQSAEHGGVCPNENKTRSISCNLPPCPIDCIGNFTYVGDCSEKCGGGKKKKVYNIIKNAEHNGIECDYDHGNEIEEDCNTQQCPIDCEGEFVDVKNCSKECGGGIKLKKYEITKQAGYDGLNCIYPSNFIKAESCNTEPCPTYPENTVIKEALKLNENNIQNIRYNIIDRQEELDRLTNKFNSLNKNINKIKTSSNYVPDDKTLTFY